MPDTIEHIEQRDSNLRLLNFLRKSNKSYYDWWIVLLFYAAVHDIEIIFSKKGEHGNSHRDREQKMFCDCDLQPIRAIYKTAFTMSRGARYECRMDSLRDFNKFFLKYKKIKDHLAALN